MRIVIVGLPSDLSDENLGNRIKEDVERGARESLGCTLDNVSVVFTDWHQSVPDKCVRFYYDDAPRIISMNERWLWTSVEIHLRQLCTDLNRNVTCIMGFDRMH